MSSFYWGLLAGFFIGGVFGIFITALLTCSREASFWEKEPERRLK